MPWQPNSLRTLAASWLKNSRWIGRAPVMAVEARAPASPLSSLHPFLQHSLRCAIYVERSCFVLLSSSQRTDNTSNKRMRISHFQQENTHLMKLSNLKHRTSGLRRAMHVTRLCNSKCSGTQIWYWKRQNALQAQGTRYGCNKQAKVQHFSSEKLTPEGWDVFWIRIQRHRRCGASRCSSSRTQKGHWYTRGNHEIIMIS